MSRGSIARLRSAHYEVDLFRGEDGALGLTLDGWWQFHEDEEAEFHLMLADVPMTLAPRVERVLILGGGDGLAARNVLRYPGVREVDLVDIDRSVIELARDQPDLAALAERSLHDPRVRVHVEDARVYLAHPPARGYDVVLCDFPVATHGDLAALFDAHFYGRVRAWMGPGAVVGVQVSQLPPGFWRVRRALLEVFPHGDGYLARLSPAGADESWGSFLVASERPLAQRREVAAPVGAPWPDVLAGRRIVNEDGPHLRTVAYGQGPEPDRPDS